MFIELFVPLLLVILPLFLFNLLDSGSQIFISSSRRLDSTLNGTNFLWMVPADALLQDLGKVQDLRYYEQKNRLESTASSPSHHFID